MIKVTIQNKGEQITVVCDKAQAVTNRQVTCYWYAQEKVEYYDGYIIAVTIA